MIRAAELLHRLWSRYTGVVALGAGAVTVLAFAPFDLYPVALLTQAILFHLWLSTPPRRAFWIGWLFGLGLLGVGVFWLHISIDQFGNVGTPLAMTATVLFVLAVAVFFGLAGWLGTLPGGGGVVRSVLLFPAAWGLIEWSRGWVLTGFPWLSLGYSQIDGPLGGYAPVLGVYGVGWLLAISAGLCVLLATDRRRRLGWGGLVLLIWLGGGLLRHAVWTRPDGPSLRVSLVQANIPQKLKWDRTMRGPTLGTFSALTRENWGSDLVVWPETAVPDFVHRVQEDFLDPLAREAQARGTEILVGAPIYDFARNRYYNGALVLGPEGGTYRKRHLVPFGEFLPLPGLLRPLLEFMEIPMSDFTAGGAARPTVLVGEHTVGVSICYEDAFGSEVIEALPVASYLVNLSNDAWFGDSLAPHQHLQIARMRALETGRPMLRATNTGISALIGPGGEIIASSAAFEKTVVNGEIQPRAGSTPYVRTGNAVTVGLLLAAFAAGVGIAGVGRREKDNAKSPRAAC